MRMIIPTLLAATVLVSLPACQSQPTIPMSAVPVSSGTGLVSYRTAEPGELFIYDRSNNTLVYRGLVNADQLVVVDPPNGRVTIGNAVVLEKPLSNADEYQFYLDRTAALPANRVIERRTIYERTTRE